MMPVFMSVTVVSIFVCYSIVNICCDNSVNISVTEVSLMCVIVVSIFDCDRCVHICV